MQNNINCNITGCQKPHHAKGYCKSHYGQLKTGTLASTKIPIVSDKGFQKCKINECEKPHHAKGYCKSHYGKIKKESQKTNIENIDKISTDSPMLVQSIKGCKTEGCLKPHHAKGYCKYHYRKIKKEPPKTTEISTNVDTVITTNNQKQLICKIEGCSKPHHAKGYCSSHYKKNKSTQTIQTSENQINNEKIFNPKIKIEHNEGNDSINIENKQESSNILKENISDEKITKIIKNIIEEENEDDEKNKKEKTKTILDEKEENLTDLQKKDLEEHRIALKRLEEMKNKVYPFVRFNEWGQRIV